MSRNEIISKIEALKELEALAAEISVEMESLKNSIKEEMAAQQTEELECGQYIIRWVTVLTNRLDTTALKRVMPSVYKDFTKQVTSRRFSIC